MLTLRGIRFFASVAPRREWVSRPPRPDWESRPSDLIKAVAFLRKHKRSLQQAELDRLFVLISDSELVGGSKERELSLTLNLLLSPGNFRPGITLERIRPVCDRLVGDDMLSLQGVNQILGAFARLKTKRSETDLSTDFCSKILKFFISKHVSSCPNRELVNIFWAANVLRLNDDDLRPIIERKLSSFECHDIANICAGIMDDPAHPSWPAVRQDLLGRKRFSEKAIGLIMCNLACAGVNDRELILHLSSVIHRTELLTIENVSAVVWAIATCDLVDFKMIDKAVSLLQEQGHLITDPMDVRRISRGFAVPGQLKRIESWIMDKVLSAQSSKDKMADTLLIWELVTCGLQDSALKLFRSRPFSYWNNQIKEHDTAASQLYHLYLGSLVRDNLDLTEKSFLESLRPRFAMLTDDMSSSVLHRQASDAVQDLKYQHVSEYQEPVSGYVVDIYIPSLNVAVEVQGPTHFVTDLETGAAILRQPDRFKEQVISNVAGLRVVHATPYNFGPKVKVRNELLMKALIENRPVPSGGFEGQKRAKRKSKKIEVSS